MKLATFYFSVAFSWTAIAGEPTISPKELPNYWIEQGAYGKLSPAMQRMSAEQFAVLKKHDVYVTMDYTIELNGKRSNIKISKIEPDTVDPKPFAAMFTLAVYKPAPGVKPTRVHVHVERARSWIPKDLP